jgi:hypothetical protein
VTSSFEIKFGFAPLSNYVAISLIAIMLGRLEMDVPSCIEAYIALSTKCLQPRSLLTKLWRVLRPRDDLKTAIKKIITDQDYNEDELLVTSNPKCKT